MLIPNLHLSLPRNPQSIAATALGGAAVLALAGWAIFRKRVTPEEREQRRRHHLALTGRIVDGSLIGAQPDEHLPEVILYRYRIAGVTYECSQDVSGVRPLGAPVSDLRPDFPLQVRYDRANPGDSIVVAENWNGLWSAGRRRLPRAEMRPEEATRLRSQEQ